MNKPAWRVEFEDRDQEEIRSGLNLIQHEPKRQFAFRWLRGEGKNRKLREERTYNYVRLTFWAAVAAVVVGVIGAAVTVF
jgi:hypothetical protein